MLHTLLPSKTSEFLITQKCNLNCSYCFEKHKSNKDISWEDFVKAIGTYASSGIPFDRVYIFGGEPLLNTPFIEKCIDYINNHPTLSKESKDTLIKSIVRNITTNGTLIDKELDFLKKYRCSLQVSIDGPEFINDANRVDYNNKGHFKHIMDNLALCRANHIQYSLHGALSKNNFKYFTDINQFFLEQALLTHVESKLSEVFYHNYVQIVFEEDITDDDIDVLLEQYNNTVNMILTTPLLEKVSYNTRQEIAEGFLNRRGGPCSAGVTLYSYDNDFNIFPCHRLNTAEDNLINNRLGSLKEDCSYNFKLYKPFQEVFRRREMYGPYLDNIKTSSHYWLNWCPSTNWETSGNVFQIPSKHNVLVAELQRFIPVLAESYNLNLHNKKFVEKT